MVSFFAECLKLLLRLLCGKPIRKTVHGNTKTALSLVKVDVNEKASHTDLNKVDLSFGVKYKIEKSWRTGRRLLAYRKEALKIVASFCSHAMEKGPLRYLFTRCLKC